MTRLRFALDLRSRDAFTDLLTGRSPVIWRAADLQFELGLFDDAALYDLTDVDQITIEVKAADDLQGPALLRVTADYADLNRSLTMEDWTAGTDAHATIPATATDTALDLDQQPSKAFHLVVSALTTDDPAKTLILGTSVLTVTESGAGGTNNAPEPAEDYYTATESDARYVKLADYTDLSGDVATAQAAADAAQGDVDALTSTVTTLSTTVSGHTTTLGEHDTRLDALEEATADLAAPGFDGTVRHLLLDGDTVFACGDFTALAGHTTTGVAKLSVQGLVDTRFTGMAGFSGSLTNWGPKRLALAADGDVLVACGKQVTGFDYGFLTKLDADTGTPRNSGTTPAWACAPSSPGVSNSAQFVDVAAMRVSGVDYVVAAITSGIYTLSATATGVSYEITDVNYGVAGIAAVQMADGVWRLGLAGLAYVAGGVPVAYRARTTPHGLRLIQPPNPASGATPWGSDADQHDDTFTAGAGDGSEASCERVIAGYDLTDGPYLIAGNVLNDDDVDHSWNGGSTTAFRGLLKVWLDGTADPDFEVGLVLTADEGAAIPFAVDGQQRLYFGGPVESINGTTVTPWQLYRITKDGTLDATFEDFDDAVLCCVLRDDDTLIVGGEFTSYAGATANRIAFLNASGQRITPALQGASAGQVWDYAALPDVRNVPALKRGLVCLTDDPPTLHRWNATAEEWTAL